MKLSPSRLSGEVFGSIQDKVRGIVTYRLSPFEQRAFAGAIRHGLPNSARRIGGVLTTVLPYFAFSYFIYSEVEKDFIRRQRKNPDDFKNDK